MQLLCSQLVESVSNLHEESAKRIFPLCKSYLLINQFVESSSQINCGLVNHAFVAALRALLLQLTSLYTRARSMYYAQTALHTLFFPRKGSFVLFVTLRWLEQMLMVYYVLKHR